MKDTNKYNFNLLSIVMIVLIFIIQGNAEVYFVAPDGENTNSGTEASPWSLARANFSLQPGDTAILLDGTYKGTPIAPTRSGVENNHIVYKTANRHMAIFQDIVELPDSRGPVAIFVNNRAYITVDGIKVLGVKRWVMGVKSHHITLTNGHFESGSGWINCRFEENGDGIRILNNYFQGGTDLLQIDGGDNHLVRGNFFGDASHTGLVLLGVKYSVVRNNRLTNRRWRDMEVESRRKVPYRLSEYNLIDGNTFDFTPTAGIQYAGNRSILRRNIFRKSLTGMRWANYLGSAKTPEAWHNESNRFYNNVVTECGTHSVVLDIIAENAAKGIHVEGNVSSEGYGMVYNTNLFNPPVPGYENVAYGDNIVKNNIFYMNFNTEQSKSANTAHIAFDWNATPEFGRYYYNNIFGGTGGAEVFYYLDAVYEKPPEPRNRSIQSFEAHYPQWASNNIEVDPQFLNSAESDYRLSLGSPCVDAGGPLTVAISGGNGTTIEVEDALYFTDGYGLIEADSIRIDSQRVKIISVDYETNTITLDRGISWPDNAPVTTDYEGEGPDLGAFEYSDLQAGLRQNEQYKLPDSFNLYQNFPNPFNPNTRIKYALAQAGYVSFNIYNIAGQKVRMLVNKRQERGIYQIVWDGKDSAGNSLASGVYFYQLIHNRQKTVKKMMLIR